MPIITWNKGTVPDSTQAWLLLTHMRSAIESLNIPTPVATATERNALNPPGGKWPGMEVVRTDTPDMRHDIWDGAVWDEGKGTTYTPIWTGVADFGTGGSMTGTYWVKNDLVYLRAKAVFGVAGTMGTAAVYCPLPSGLPIAGTQTLVLGNGVHVAGTIIRPLLVYAGSNTTASVWAPTIPVQTPGQQSYPAGQNDYFEIAIQYQTTTP